MAGSSSSYTNVIVGLLRVAATKSLFAICAVSSAPSAASTRTATRSVLSGHTHLLHARVLLTGEVSKGRQTGHLDLGHLRRHPLHERLEVVVSQKFSGTLVFLQLLLHLHHLPLLGRFSYPSLRSCFSFLFFGWFGLFVLSFSYPIASASSSNEGGRHLRSTILVTSVV